MPSYYHVTHSATCAVLLACATGPSQAQRVEIGAMAERCDAIATRLHNARHNEAMLRDLSDIQQCGRSGPPVLVRLWSQRPTQPEVVQQLFVSTRQLHDERLLRVLVRTSADDAAAPTLRVRALIVLASHADPLLRDLTPTGDSLVPFAERRGFRETHTLGERPFEPGYRTRTIAHIGQLSVSAGDYDVRRVAKHLHQWLEIRQHR